MLIQLISCTALDMGKTDICSGAVADEQDVEGCADFAGIVGIINRRTDTQEDLNEAGERSVFQDRLLADLPSEFEPHRAQLEKCIGIPHLIEKINQQFSSFIIKKWKPGALDQLTPTIKAVEGEIRHLGQPISELTIQQVMAEVVQQVSVVQQPFHQMPVIKKFCEGALFLFQILWQCHKQSACGPACAYDKATARMS